MAYSWVSRYAGSYVVTLSVDQVMFRQPIHVGALVTFMASVHHTGTSSLLDQRAQHRVFTRREAEHLVRQAKLFGHAVVAQWSAGKARVFLTARAPDQRVVLCGLEAAAHPPAVVDPVDLAIVLTQSLDKSGSQFGFVFGEQEAHGASPSCGQA